MASADAVHMAAAGPVLAFLAFPANAFRSVDLNPLNWLGDAASAAAADGWQAAMIGLWSAGLWLLKLAFGAVDAVLTPDLGADGPMGAVLPTTLWLGAAAAVLMMFCQLAAAVLRRDGQSLGRIFIGIAQFGLVWTGYLAVAGVLVVAAGGLAHGLLSSLLHVNSWSELDPGSSWPREVTDTSAATVLGIASILLLIPACFAYVLIMLVREAAIIVLVATSPICAAGLLNDTTKTWFWKSLRWLIACLLIAPLTALILGVGVKISEGVVSGAGHDTAAAVGTAVVGCMLVAIGAVCPLVLFRLLAFVEPGTASGAALRSAWSDAGGAGGLLGGGQQVSSPATAEDGGGRAMGESAADSQTQSRLTAMMGQAGQATQRAAGFAGRAADIGADVLGSAGVGHGGFPLAYADAQARNQRSSPAQSPGSQGGEGGDDGTGQPSPPASPPLPPAGPPAPPGPGGGPTAGGGPAGPAGGAGGGAAASGAGGEAAAAAVVL